MVTSRKLLTSLLSLATVLATTTACGGDPDRPAQGPPVLSLESSAPGGTPASMAPVDAGRPQLRQDMSDEEADAVWETYKVCLHNNGVKENKERAQAGGATGLVLDDSGEPKSAYRACAGKLPLQPPELDDEKNPNYAAQYNDYIQCLRKNRLYVHALADGSGWTYDDVDQPLNDDQRTKVDKTCTKASFHVG